MKFAKLLKRISLSLVAVTAFTLTSGQAMADQIFTFTFSGVTASGSGTLDAISNGDGSFTATSGTGTETVSGITDVINLIFNSNGTAAANSPTGAFFFDNQLFPGSDTLITSGGLLFQSSTQEMNLFSTGPGSYLFYQQDNFNEKTVFTLASVQTVPEPTTIFLFATAGLMGIIALRRKGQKKNDTIMLFNHP